MSTTISTELSTSIDNRLKQLCETGDLSVREEIMADISSNEEEYVNVMRQYQTQEFHLKKEADDFAKRDEVRNILEKIDGLKQQVKEVKILRDLLKNIVVEYMEANDKCTMEGNDVTFTILPDSIIGLSISEELNSKLQEMVNTLGLPEWLKVEFKLDTTMIKNMDKVPEGVNYSRSTKLAGPSSVETTVRMYRECSSIDEVAANRGLSPATITSHLNTALNDGLIQSSELRGCDLVRVNSFCSGRFRY